MKWIMKSRSARQVYTQRDSTWMQSSVSNQGCEGCYFPSSFDFSGGDVTACPSPSPPRESLSLIDIS